MDQYKEAYTHEAHEHLADLESALLELEKTPDDKGLIALVFRKMHTIKGSAAMFGFADVAAFIHEAEAVFDFVRKRKIRVTKRLVDLTLSACDLINKIVDGIAIDPSETNDVVKFFREINPSSGSSSADRTSLEKESSFNESGSKIFRIRFRPFSEIFASGKNPVYLLDDLRELGECTIVPHTNDIPPVTEINPEVCYLFWDVILTTNLGIEAIKGVFIPVENECDLVIDMIGEQGFVDSEAEWKKLGEILLERGDISIEDLRKTLGKQKRVGEMLVEEKFVDPETLQSALAEQQHVRKIREGRQGGAASSTVSVPAERLDELVDLVNELVTVQARFSRAAASFRDSEFLSIAEEVERLTTEIRDNTRGIRMLPAGGR